ncbi:amino acid adenylation domain-containing protein, partial [Xanthomonas albilineans]
MDNSVKSLPASFVQKRMWLLAKLDPQASISYHMANGVRLIGALDIDALQAALDRIVLRHEVLRTSLIEVNGQVRQRIHATMRFPLVHEDASTLDIARITQYEARQPFDLELGAPVRGRLLRLTAQEHVLLLTFHHIACDGWSIGILLRELEVLYAAFVCQQPDPLPPLPIQYADYAIWQSEQLQGDTLDAQLRFWTGQLNGAPTLLALPTDRARPAIQDYQGAVVELLLPTALAQGLNALARRHGCSLFVTLLAGWALLLTRISTTDEVMIGTPVAGRTHPDLEGLIGCFINTLALRLDVSATPNVGQWLAHVRDLVLKAQDHQELPFERVVEALQPNRSLSYTPLFQTLFSLDGFSGDQSLQMPGLRLEPLPNASNMCAFDLILEMQESESRLGGCIKYPTALFDQATIQDYAAQFVHLLQAMSTHDGHRVDRLPWVPETQRHRVLHDFNAAQAILPPFARLSDALLAQVQRTPEATALIDGTLHMSYAQLWNRAACLANHLQEYGLLAGQPVGLLMPRSADLIVAQLAVLMCGACYVPMDLEQPSERLSYLLHDCHARLALVHTLAPPLDVPGLRCVNLQQILLDEAATPPRPFTHPLGAAYVMYTSGSTGQPKGVVIPQHAVLNLVMQDGPARLRTSDRVAFASNPAFDSATLEVWGSLLNGATVVVVPAATLREPVALAAMLRNAQISVLILVAGVLRVYAPLLAPQLSALRMLLTGGDVADPQALTTVLQAGGQVSVLQTYGPTESTQFVTALALDQAPDASRPVPIGRPLSGNRAYVLDRHGQPTPIGVAGELHLAGLQLAQGYLHRPALTAERFVPDPFAQQPGQRMYKTGDLARWLADGSLDFLGRNDDQIKIRGFRIEPGEITAALCACPTVRQAVVIADARSTGDTRLIAYVVGEDTLALDAETLHTQLRARLPDYMVPTAYVQLDVLPLTANGKLDRRALPAADADALALQAYAPPESELETQLADLWRALLDIEQVGRRDDFFALGGHSLLAVQLASRMRQRLGVAVSLADIFAHPRLADLANAVTVASTEHQPAIVPSPRNGPLPLSFAQQRLWFLDVHGHSGAAYALAYVLRLHGTLDTTALRRALNRIVARHEILRTRFATIDGQPQQMIAPADSGFALIQHDLSDESDPLQAAHAHADAQAQAPFDLQSGPLLRGCLLRLGERDHVLLLTAHHIITDAWSGGVLVNELSALYGAFTQGLPDPLPALPIQYADFAIWQRRWMTGERLQHQLAHWIAHLSDAPTLLQLPTDSPRPAQQDHRGDLVSLHLDAAQTAALKALAQRHGATLFMVILAGWAALLARLSGQQEVVIGTPIANRHHAELEPLIGMLVNSLAIRIDLRHNPSVAALLAQTRATALAAQTCQDIPFEHVVEALNPVRSTAHNPIFQVMLAWQNASEGQLTLPALTVETLPGTHRAAQFDLELSMQESDDGIVGSLVFATALFTRARIQRHVRQLLTLLARMSADDNAAVSTLSAIEPQELAQLHSFNATTADLDGSGFLHHAIAAQARRTPQAIAVVAQTQAIHYAELDARANQLAHHLIGLGVVPERIVAVCLPRGIDLIVAILAVLKAGAAYLPLDSDVPAARLHAMCADARPSVLLAHRESAALLTPREDLHTILLDDAPSAWACAPTHAPVVATLHPQHPAYVIYTSGSTGTPKGVVNTHAAIDNRLQWMQQALQLQPQQRVLQKTPIGFDVSVWELFWPLRVGGCLVLAQPGGHKDPAYLKTLIEQASIDTAHFVPSMLRVFLDALPQGACRTLSRIVCSGETLLADLARDTRTRLPQARLYNLYGPTEAAVDVSAWECGEADVTQVPIGRPIANTQLHVLNAYAQLAPLGVAGELHIAGMQLARGYLGRPDLTAERFVPDPFADQPGARMYRTGDLARWRADGALDYLGRNDDQIKLRGFRIELGEIEAALRTCTGVQDAVVLLREDSPGEPRLVAYLVGDAEQLGADTLRTQLAARLPEAMLPAAYVQLKALPLTTNGKLDRKALPAPGADALATQTYLAPEGELETVLAGLWRELLGVEQVGRGDDFFALGGHSLLAVQLIARIRDRLGMEIQIGDVFNHSQLQALAQCLERSERSDAQRIVTVDRHAAMPLSFAQQRLWFLDRFDPESQLAYLMPGGVRLSGALDSLVLRRALDRIVHRHEALRTRFAMEHDVPVQRIADAQSRFPLHCIDLRTLPDPEAAAHDHAAEEAGTRFDLEHDTLVRGRLLRLAEQEHLLLITMHHIVSDGWSIGVLMRELGALYTAFLEGRADPLPPLRVQYADYSSWQRQRISGQMHERQRDFWRNHLQGAPALLELPTDHARPPHQDYAGDSVAFALDHAQSTALKQLGQRHGTTLYMTLLAAWAVLLSRLSGQNQVVIGTPVANRTHEELEPLIGFFVNTQALRLDLSGNPSVAQLLTQVRATTLAAQSHQDLPFDQLIEILNPERNLAAHPLFQVMLNWENLPESELQLSGLRLQQFGLPAQTIKFDLQMGLQEAHDGRIVGTLGYATALFERSTIERHLHHFFAVLHGMVADEHCRVERLPLFSTTERQQWLQRLARQHRVFADQRCLPSVFEQQAARTPQAIAVVDGQCTLCYADLDARANQLAHHLIAHGIGPEDRIAL